MILIVVGHEIVGSDWHFSFTIIHPFEIVAWISVFIMRTALSFLRLVKSIHSLFKVDELFLDELFKIIANKSKQFILFV